VIAITGAAVLSALGDSPDVVVSALREGGVARNTIQDFDASRYASVRGMRMYNRTTRLAICATRLALTDAKIDRADDLGVLMASTYGHLDVLIEYDRNLVANGIARTNAAMMPLAIPSAPGAMVALAFGAKAFSMTLSNGDTSSLDALGLGARWISERRARAAVVVAAFSPSDGLGADGGLGEAAVAFVLERADDAADRRPRGYVRGYGAAFSHEDPDSAVERACAGALRAANVSAEATGAPVPSVKAALGDTFDASGALQTLVALGSLRDRNCALVASCRRDGGASAIVVADGARS
jgi:3-oxoacyl-(acyl-carrier-protein) synthase